MSAPRRFTSLSESILQPRLPELLKIKIGGKGKLIKSRKGKDFRLPVKFDHFKVCTREKGSDDNWIPDPRIHNEIGEEPKELDVRLISDEIEDNFEASLAAYDGRRCICSGNGDVAYDRELEQEIACPCPLLAQFEGKYEGPKRPVGKATCKPHGVLKVHLEAAKSYGAFTTFRTTSWESISSLRAQLELYKKQFGGILAGLPLKLVVYPAQDTYEDEKGQLKTSTSYKVALVLRANYQEALQLAAATYEMRQELSLPAGARAAEAHRRLLAAPAEEEEAEGAEISKEFHPETQGGYVEEVEGVVVDEEEEIAEAEADRLEAVLYQTLEFAEWKKLRINRQLAKYAGRLDELEKVLEKEFPTQYEQAKEFIARAEAEADAAETEEAEAAEQEIAEAAAEGERELEEADADVEAEEEDDELSLF